MILVENVKSTIYEFGRDKDNKPYVKKVNFKPYFYVLDSNGEYISLTGERLTKIVVESPDDVPLLKRQYPKTYESDVVYVNRYIIDNYYNKDIPKQNIRKWYFDIEVDDSDGLQPVLDYKKEIISITIYDSYNDKYITLHTKNNTTVKKDDKHLVIGFDSEKKLLQFFIRLLKKNDPDMLIGWNVWFDISYILKRMQFYNYNIDQLSRIHRTVFIPDKKVVKLRGRIVFDLMDGYKQVSLNQLPSYSLEFVSQHEIGEGKEKYKGKIMDLSLKKLISYNKRDVELLKLLDEKLHIIDLFDTIRRFAKVNFHDVFSAKRIIDSFCLSYAKKKGLILPSQPENAKHKRFAGAYVKQPPKGLHEWVIGLDFKSLYPSIIRQFNMSYETFLEKPEDGCINIDNKFYFKKEPKGFIPQIVDYFIEERKKFKKLMKESRTDLEYRSYYLSQWALKIIANATYGVITAPFFRLFNPNIGEAITYMGRRFIKFADKYWTDNGYEVVVSDSVSKDTIIPTSKGFVRIEDLFKKVDYKVGDKEYYIPKDLKVMSADLNKKEVVMKKVKYIMRHKTSKKMYRVWITNTEYVDVTEDHSLIGYVNTYYRYKYKKDFVEVKPQDLGKDIKTLIILNKYEREKIIPSNYDKNLIYLMGYFVADGSFMHLYNSQRHSKNYLKKVIRFSFGNDIEFGLDLLNNLKKNGYIKSIWVHKKGDISVNGKIVDIFIKEIYNKNHKHYKVIPKFIFKDTEENIISFLQGYLDADGTVIKRDNKPITRITSTDLDYLEDLQKLFWILGIPTTIFTENNYNYYKTKDKVYGGKSISKHLVIKDILKFMDKVGFRLKRKSKKLNVQNLKESYFKKGNLYLAKVYKVEEIEYNGYVYDIEVKDTHTFFGNGILLHNTDSTYVKLNVNSLDEAIRVGNNLYSKINSLWSDFLNQFNASPNKYMEMEFEKVYHPLLTIGVKKRYAGFVVYKDDKKLQEPQLDVKGLQIVRSDFPIKAQKFLKQVIIYILQGKDRKFILDYINEFKKEFKQSPIEEIGFPTSLRQRDGYKNKPIQLRAMLNSEKYLNMPYTDGKVRYYFVKKTPKEIPYDNVWIFDDELPEGFELDWDRFFERIIKNPLEPIFESVGWDLNTTLKDFI